MANNTKLDADGNIAKARSSKEGIAASQLKKLLALKLSPEKLKEVRALKGVFGTRSVGERHGLTGTQVQMIWDNKI